MNVRQGVAPTAMDQRQSQPWIELVLPAYALGVVITYYRPEVLPAGLQHTLMDGMFRWVTWGIVGALGGVLAFSGLFLAFYLLYSPIYLVENARRILDRRSWVDRREVRFYLGCFSLLVLLLLVAFLHPEAALVSFLLLSGFAHFLWRILV